MVTVIVAVPAPLAVTTPPVTVATEVSLEDQLTPWLLASVGATTAFSVAVPPFARISVVWSSVTPVTAMLSPGAATASVRGIQPVRPVLDVPFTQV